MCVIAGVAAKGMPSTCVPALKSLPAPFGAVSCNVNEPVMSGERVSDWPRSPRSPVEPPYINVDTSAPVESRSVTAPAEFPNDNVPVEAFNTIAFPNWGSAGFGLPPPKTMAAVPALRTEPIPKR